MKKFTKSLAVLMCFLTAVAFMPAFAFAAEQEIATDGTDTQQQTVTEETQDTQATGEPDSKSEPAKAPKAKSEAETTAEPAANINVKMTVSNQGVIAKSKDGSTMVNKEVTVNDIDEDGLISYDEAIVATHESYCAEGVAGYVNEGFVTKLWGVSTSNVLFFVNNEGLNSVVSDVEVNDGDYLTMSINCDDVNNADWYTYFDKKERTVDAGEEFTLNLKGFQGMAGGAAKNVEGVKVGIWKDGAFEQIGSAVTDKNGNASLVIDEAGTYVVTASGAVKDTWKDWSGKTITADCPIIAPACVVTVKAAPINVYLTVSNKGKVATDKDGKAMAQRAVVVNDINEDGQYSYGEALTAAHERYAENGASDYNASGTMVSKLWGDDSGNYLFFINNVPIPTGVNDDEVKDGDYLLASINKDTLAYADSYAFFDDDLKAVKVGKSFDLTLKSYPGMASVGTEIESSPVVDAKIGVVGEDGRFSQIHNKETDNTGKVSLSFDKAGTYYITAEGNAIIPEVEAWGLINMSTTDNPMFGTMDTETYESDFAYTEKDYGDGPYPGSEIKYVDLFEYKRMNDTEKAKYHILRSNQIKDYLSPIMAPVCKVIVDDNVYDLVDQLKKTVATLKAAAISPAAKAKAASTTSVKLSWTVSDDAAGYEVSKDSGKTWTPAKGSSVTYSKLVPGTKYTYKVRGFVYLDGEGTDKYYSKVSTATVTTPLAKASVYSLKSKSRKLTAKWYAVSGATSYQVYISTNSKFTKGLVKYTTSAKYKTSKKLRKGKTYYVKVRAYKKGVYGPWSATKKIKCR